MSGSGQLLLERKMRQEILMARQFGIDCVQFRSARFDRPDLRSTSIDRDHRQFAGFLNPQHAQVIHSHLSTAADGSSQSVYWTVIPSALYARRNQNDAAANNVGPPNL